MNILWDFRLFSFGYRSRGVGSYVSAMADAICEENSGNRIIVWGEKRYVPRRFHEMSAQWIEYIPRTWKSDLFVIPFLTVKYHIDIFHYWIALGPLFNIGLGIRHPFCKACLTVHDCGVEYWDKVPICASTKKTRYWKIQKVLFPRADRIICNSYATQTEIARLFKRNLTNSIVLYPPVRYFGRNPKIERTKRFITLGGDAHKNTIAVIEAYQRFSKQHSGYSLVVLGEHDCMKTDIPGVSFENMEHYSEYLENAAGLIVCSFYEGLGLPVVEGMSRDCPLVLSDIPVFNEICPQGGIFVDPYESASIALGMEECALHGEEWAKKSSQGAARYREMSADAGKKWIGVYHDLKKKEL
jgi:glycosyltransferase involved in cell wall biosynthesis